MFKRCCFKFMPVTVPFSKSTVFKICRQKMCRFRVNGRPIRRIFHRFQNVPASCERSLKHHANLSEGHLGVTGWNSLSNHLGFSNLRKADPWRNFGVSVLFGVQQSCKKYRNLATRFPENFSLGRNFSEEVCPNKGK